MSAIKRVLCEMCDRPVAVTADYERCRGGCECTICATLCWGPPCYDAIDWRVRAKEYEAKAALADAMWHRLDTINRPLDEYEGQWYVEYDEKVKP